MKINQQKIEKAVQVLEALYKSSYPGGFPNEMKGDISSFGASIIQAGLLPSVLFFSEGEYNKKAAPKKEQDEDTKVRRAQVMKAVFDLLELPADKAAQYNAKRPLLDYVLQSKSKPETLDDITEAALAIKVALRAFPFKVKGKNTEIPDNIQTETP